MEYDIVEVRVKYRGKVVWQGGREKSSGLWILPMSPEDPAQLKLSEPKWIDAVNTLGMNATRLLSRPREQANNAFATTTKADLIKYLHQAAFSPVKQTFLKAIKNGQFATWPGLTEEAVKKYLPESSPATDKGHMKRQQKNIRSTKKEENGKRAAAELNSKETVEDMHPKLEHDAFNQLFAYTIQMDAKDGTTYMDCTGKFPIRSVDGMVTIFILYDWSSNAILAEPIPNTKDKIIIRVFKEKIEYLTSRGFKPKFNILDNIASKAIVMF